MERKYNLVLPSGARLRDRIADIERDYSRRLADARTGAGDNQTAYARAEAEADENVKHTIALLLQKSVFWLDEPKQKRVRRGLNEAGKHYINLGAGTFIERSQPKNDQKRTSAY